MSDENVEVKAKELGWSPKEEFRGDPEKWIDAETFVKRGEELMPLLKANNRKLHDELSNVRSELTKTQNLLNNAAESIEALKEFNNKETLKVAKEERGKLAAALKEARNEGDVEKELEIADKLEEQKVAIKAAEAPPAKSEPIKATADDPVFQEWRKDNPWFGEDEFKSDVALAIGNRLKIKEPSLTGRAFLDKVSEEVDKRLGSIRSNGVGKVEGARGGGGSPEAGKTYSDLPAEAKAACDKQAQRLVGQGRAFKDANEWRKHYAKKYFEESP